jgi:hypothetical protein
MAVGRSKRGASGGAQSASGRNPAAPPRSQDAVRVRHGASASDRTAGPGARSRSADRSSRARRNARDTEPLDGVRSAPDTGRVLASAHFGLTRSDRDDWFDTILDVDTELFVDPFLVFKEADGFWSDAHARLIAHFNQAFLLVAQGSQNRKSLPYKKALRLLEFREPGELCLGYTARGTSGSGSGGKLGRLIAQAIEAAITRGLTNPSHFEELGVLQERIGSDRISDTTCTILKPKLIEYTQDIATRHGIPMASHRLYAGSFDAQRQRFEHPNVMVPTNPKTGGPLLFVPRRFLRDLPQLNKDDWWDYFENEQLRDDLNYEVMGNVDKRTIVETARANMDSVRRWADDREGQPGEPYDFDADPKGVVQWESAAAEFTQANPLAIKAADDAATFDAVIDLIIEQFRLFIEEQRGWSLLWDGAKDKPETAAQLIFYGLARNYCQANNIVIDPETDFGRGPVDFKFSNGYRHRAHLEVKKLHNGKFWNGLDRQLPAYMSSDQVDKGRFLAIRYRDGKKWDGRADAIPDRVRAAAKAHGRDLRGHLVDARPTKSASKL